MSENSNKSKHPTEKTVFIRSELEKIAENSDTSKSSLTLYFDDRDSNPLKNVTMSKITNNEFTSYHKHEFYEMNFVIKGRLHEHISGNSIVLEEGDILLMSPGVYHTCYPASDSFCLNIIFRNEWLENIAGLFCKYDNENYLSAATVGDIYLVFHPSMQGISLIPEVKKLNEYSKKVYRHQNLYENLHFENSITEFLLQLTMCTPHVYSSLTGERKGRPNYSPNDMIRYLNDNFDKVTLEEAATKFGYSSSQFHRIIKKNTGKSFTDNILSIRMMRARHLLINTNIPIKDIAVLLGLDSAEHFSRMFKKNRGITPKEYRNSFGTRESNYSNNKKKQTAD